MIDMLRNRRSIRKYLDKKIEPQKIKILQEALLRSPSSRNSNPWEFIFVDQPELLIKISQAKEHGSAFVAGAPLGVVICGDETKSDVWVEDCSIAAIILQLTAQSLGLGSCWVQIRNRMYSETVSSANYIRELLGVPGTIRIECICAIGYPVKGKEGLPREMLLYEKIRKNMYR